MGATLQRFRDRASVGAVPAGQEGQSPVREGQPPSADGDPPYQPGPGRGSHDLVEPGS